MFSVGSRMGVAGHCALCSPSQGFPSGVDGGSFLFVEAHFDSIF